MFEWNRHQHRIAKQFIYSNIWNEMYTVIFEMSATITFEMNDTLRNVVVRIKSTEYSHNKTNMDAFTFTATVASKGYHVHKTTSWINAKAGEKGTVELETTAWSLDTDPYACAIRIKNKYFSSLITVGHIPRDISRHVHLACSIGMSSL